MRSVNTMATHLLLVFALQIAWPAAVRAADAVLQAFGDELAKQREIYHGRRDQRKALAAGALYSAELNMFATPENFSLVKRLLWTDVTNAGAWMIVGTMIELEIFMRVTRRATPRFLAVSRAIAAPFWLVLVVNVFYWWWLSDVLDAWDAFLWIVAFFFIELNMIAKHEENARRRAAESHA